MCTLSTSEILAIIFGIFSIMIGIPATAATVALYFRLHSPKASMTDIELGRRRPNISSSRFKTNNIAQASKATDYSQSRASSSAIFGNKSTDTMSTFVTTLPFRDGEDASSLYLENTSLPQTTHPDVDTFKTPSKAPQKPSSPGIQPFDRFPTAHSSELKTNDPPLETFHLELKTLNQDHSAQDRIIESLNRALTNPVPH